MSQQLEANISCPKCKKVYPTRLYRSVWAEDTYLREEIMNDNINIVKCPHCNFQFHAPFAMMYTDHVKCFSLWWEPKFDEEIDKYNSAMQMMIGDYFKNSPRVTDWEEFKDKIKKFESGELKPIRGNDKENQTSKSEKENKSSKSGCWLLIAVIVIAIIVYILI